MKRYLIFTFLLVFLLAGCFPNSNSETVKVPNFVGMKASVAQELAKTNGLILQVISAEQNDEYPVDTVISQDIPPGSEVKKGGFVKIVLSSGPKSFSVPNAVGLDFKDAKELIVSSGLSIGIIKEVESTEKVGIVLKQNPDAYTIVQGGSKVDLTIGIGEFVKVPDVIGKSVDEAKLILEQAGLVLYKVDTFEDSEQVLPKNIVLYQYPVPNAFVEKGTQVLLRIAK